MANSLQNEKRSIADVIAGRKKITAEEVKQDLTNALVETEAQKEIYRTAALRAIAKAKRAMAAGNSGEKAIAYNELKFAYGVYHYMDSLHTAFLTIESQLQINRMTEDFARVVSNLKSIRVPASNVNFNKLTATALKQMESLDLSDLDDMVTKLIHGSMNATNASQASDRFLDDLVSGKISLEEPYSAKTAEVEQPAAEETEKNADTVGEDDLLAMLDQINAGLKGQ